MKPDVKDVNTLEVPMEDVEILHESNLIEREESMEALEDAVLAWNFVLDRKSALDLETILGAHYLLMHRLRPDIAGKIRECDVWIGGKLKKFISVVLLEDVLLEWLSSCEKEASGWKKIMKREEKEAAILKWHIFFEETHPFEDGNGRIGRILHNFQRKVHGFQPMLIRSGDEQKKYYGLFSGDVSCAKFIRFINENRV